MATDRDTGSQMTILWTTLLASLVALTAALIGGTGKVYVTMDQPFVKVQNIPEEEEIEGATFKRSTVWFKSKGERCHAWLYLPLARSAVDEKAAPPVVVMGHGLGGQKDMGLAAYAETFSSRGMASFVFDYRNFGGSDGMPRNLVDPWRHIEDFHAALDHVRSTSLDGRVDSKRIALWGTSFAGGHVLRVASEDKPPANTEAIRAIVSQVPHLDGRAASKRSMKERGFYGTLRMAGATIGDNFRGLLGMEARYVTLVGTGDDVCIMKLSPQGQADYFAKHPKEYLGGWRNQVCARIGARVGLYSPIKVVDQVKAPILFVGGEKDELCPIHIIREAAAKAPNARVSAFDITHFELYLGDILKLILEEMANFLEEHLKQH